MTIQATKSAERVARTSVHAMSTHELCRHISLSLSATNRGESLTDARRYLVQVMKEELNRR